MKKILVLIMTLIFTSNFFCAEVLAATDEEKAQKKEAKLQKKREKKISKTAKENNFKKVLELAEQEDIFAEIILCYAYKTEQRIKKDTIKMQVLQKKIEHTDKEFAENFIPAEYGNKKIKLSQMFGIAAYHAHFKNNFEKAVFWAQMGASENDTFSFAYLGTAYYTGRGVGQDYKMAIDFLKKAGDEPLALKILSDAYEKGNGVEKDLKKSKIYADYSELLKKKKNKKKKLSKIGE